MCVTLVSGAMTAAHILLKKGLYDTYNREFAEPVLTDRPPVEGAEGLAENIVVAFRSFQSHKFQGMCED